MVIAESSEATMAKAMINPNGLNSWPAIPLIKARGRYTTMVVMVPATMDAVTSFVPSTAASNRVLSLALLRKQLSSTTMELSTIIPTPMTRLAIVMIFNENPAKRIIINAVSTETGMELATIREAFQSPKNRNRITIEMIIAISKVDCTDSRELLIPS